MNITSTGVDKCDQHLNYYAIGRKSIKWWKKVFFCMCEMSIINAMCCILLEIEESWKRQSHKKFRVRLVHELVEPLLQKRSESTSGLVDSFYLQGQG